jgi:hypothetical protein
MRSCIHGKAAVSPPAAGPGPVSRWRGSRAAPVGRGRPALIRHCGSYLAVVWSICYLAYAHRTFSHGMRGRSQENAVAAETAGFPAAGPATATRCPIRLHWPRGPVARPGRLGREPTSAGWS